jgi:hypothetical protein
MAENADPGDKNSGKPKSHKSKKIREVKNSLAQADTINSKEEKELMEVHKHPHHVTEKKKWPEYLLEFLMIFFAVTLGFFAENMRENIVEKQREKQFMISFVRDLELDTLELTAGKEFRIQKIQAIDSTLTFLADRNTYLLPAVVFSLSTKFYGCRAFYQNSGTTDQLKNSGGLRLIRNRKIVDAIEAYDQQVRRMKVRDEFEIELFMNNDRIAQNLFDAKSVISVFGSRLNPDTLSARTTFIKINLPYKNEYINNLLKYEPMIRANLGLFETSKQKALNLIKLIKNEYKLKQSI